MARPRQPVDILVAKGKKHLTKAEISRRKESEIKLGTNKFECPDYVKNDVIAYAKWKEIIKFFKEFDCFSSSDIGILGRYCMTFSEYHRLLKHRQNIDNIDYFESDEEAELSDQLGEDVASDLIKKVNYIISADGVLKIDTAINKKMEMLIKMEDRLLLNPISKIKNVPKKEEPKEDPLASKGFGNI